MTRFTGVLSAALFVSNVVVFFSGGGGIRTHESFRTPVFKAGALNHSATPPGAACIGKAQARAGPL